MAVRTSRDPPSFPRLLSDRRAPRASRLPSIRRLSLDDSVEFIGDDELVEVTPLSIRIRKKILRKDDRAKSMNRASKELEQV